MLLPKPPPQHPHSPQRWLVMLGPSLVSLLEASVLEARLRQHAMNREEVGMGVPEHW